MAEPTEQEILSDAVRTTETESLNEAFQDEPAEETEPVAEEAEQDKPDAETKLEPARNEKGQFAPKDQPKADAQQEPKGDEQKGDDKDDQVSDVPRWRLREIAEER